MYKFKPLLKQTIWGGERIIPFKHLDETLTQVGESWEISGIPGNETVVADGPEAGLTPGELVARHREQLVGAANYRRFGNEFPLLIKFIDAKQNLSIQVHPNDEAARLQGRLHGKNEMWYTLPSTGGGFIYDGLKHRLTPAEYKRRVADDTICDALARYDIVEGDVFFIPAGRIHSIGAGCFVIEIQQTSDITYRIYDFGRRDANGNPRELHTELAAESIDYSVRDDYRTHYTCHKNMRNEVVSCPFFTTAVYDIDRPMTLDYSALDAFVILIAAKGAGTIADESGTSQPFSAGDTLLLPATTNAVTVGGNLKFLETYVI